MDLLCRFRGYVRPGGALAVVVRDQVAALYLPTQISRPQPVISSPY
jgi:hypothetical protein